jgi:hypothetical protein
VRSSPMQTRIFVLFWCARGNEMLCVLNTHLSLSFSLSYDNPQYSALNKAKDVNTSLISLLTGTSLPYLQRHPLFSMPTLSFSILSILPYFLPCDYDYRSSSVNQHCMDGAGLAEKFAPDREDLVPPFDLLTRDVPILCPFWALLRMV